MKRRLWLQGVMATALLAALPARADELASALCGMPVGTVPEEARASLRQLENLLDGRPPTPATLRTLPAGLRREFLAACYGPGGLAWRAAPFAVPPPGCAPTPWTEPP